MIPISTINTSSAKPTDCVVQAIVETWLYDVIKIAKLDRERNTSRPSHRHFSTKSSHHLIRTLDHRTFAITLQRRNTSIAVYKACWLYLIKITENTCNQIINAFCKNLNDYQDDSFQQSCQLSRPFFSQRKAHLEVMTAQKRGQWKHRDRQSQQCPYVSSAPPGRQAGVTVTMDTDTISD